MIVYLARDIPAFVMECVNGASHSSLLIESTDSMIYRPSKHVYITHVPLILYNCKQSESIECSMAQILAIYIFQAVCRAVSVLNVSMCI